MRAPRWYLAFMLANVALGGASQLLPLYAYFLGASAGDVGVLASVGSLANIVASVIWGRAADATPRRRAFVLFGLFGVSLSYLAVPFLSRVPHLFWVNALASFTWMAAATVSTLLILSQVSQAEWEREIGRFNAYAGGGWTLGLLLGAAWTSGMSRLVGEGWGLRSFGLVLALVALGSAILAMMVVPEPEKVVGRQVFKTWTEALGTFVVERFRHGPTYLAEALRPSQLLRFIRGQTEFGPEIILCYYGTFLAFVAFSLVFTPFPVFLRHALGWSNELVFSLYVVNNAVSVVAYSWARRAVAAFGHRLTLSLTVLLRTGIFAGFAAVRAESPAFLLPLLFALAGLSWAFFQLSITALVSRLSPQGMKGQGLGLYSALSGLGNMVGAVLGGFLADGFGFTAPFLSAAALLLLALPIFLVEGRAS